MRDLLRQRMVVEHKRTNIIQRIHSILAQFNITTLPVSPYQTGFADFLAQSSIPEEYWMTLSMYHQQATMFYPEIKHFAARLERRATKAIARTVVAKKLAKISYYVLSLQEEFKTFKGVKIDKLRDWPCARKPGHITGGA